MRKLAIVLVASSLLSGLAQPAKAQLGLSSLLMPTSVRSIGMGETGGADDSDPANSFYNPALLATQSSVYLIGFTGDAFREFIDDIRFKGFSLEGGYQFEVSPDLSVGLGGALGYSKLSFGETVATDVNGMALGTYEPFEQYYRGALAAGITMRNGFSAGLGASLQNWDADFGSEFSSNATFDATAYDIGTFAAFALGDVTEWSGRVGGGLSWINNGDGPKRDGREVAELPAFTNYALSFTVASPTTEIIYTDVPIAEFVLNMDAATSDEGNPVYRVGGELSFVRIISLRLGWEKVEGSEVQPLLAGFGLGLSTAYYMVRFDYAMVPIELLGTDRDVDKYDNKFAVVAALFFQ